MPHDTIMVVLRPRSLLALQQQRVSTGCPQLDEVLGGGLPCGSLTEVTGELKEQCVIGAAQAPPATGCRWRRRAAPWPHCRRRARRPPPDLAGEAAASKPQLCLQLLLSVQLPQQYGGLGGSAVYVYTEGEPATRRLHQLAQGLPLR